MQPVYLDHAATTPVRDEVRAAMEPYASEVFGNPSSVHRWGRAAADALEGAREEIAAALGARRAEIRFVRGGTESDNLGVCGACRAIEGRGVPTLAVSRIEHSAVLEAAEHLAQRGEAKLSWIDVAADGTIDAGALQAPLREGPAVVSVMWVNNETGLVLPIAEVVEVASGHDATVHTDASQAVGKVPVDVARVPVDLLTATGHKIGGPKGVGLLYVRSGTAVAPLLHGGGQERSLRPGTEDVAGAVGLATAVRLAVEEREAFARHCLALRNRLEQGLRADVADVRVNSGEGERAPHVASFGFPGLDDGEALVMALDLEGVAVSGGSACHSGTGRASHVIAALYGDDDRLATVRFSFGKSTTEADVARALAATTRVFERQREAVR